MKRLELEEMLMMAINYALWVRSLSMSKGKIAKEAKI